MEETRFAGIEPRYPWPLSRWTWLTGTEPAERLAAFRIGVALVLLWDILCTYLPLTATFFGQGSLGSPEVFARGQHPWHTWSLFRGIDDPATYRLVLLSWAAAALCLLIGVWPRLAAAWCWACSISIIGVNSYLHNSGDNVRTIALFYLMLSPCGAVWTLPGWLRGERRVPTFVAAWPLRLLLVQLAAIYFINGVYKMSGGDWRTGQLMHYVMGNLGWTRFSYAAMPIPLPLLQLATWTVLLWEFSFPMLLMLPRWRPAVLCLGISFHLGTATLLQLGPFPFYMICLYLPLAPWERWLARTQANANSDKTEPEAALTGAV